MRETGKASQGVNYDDVKTILNSLPHPGAVLSASGTVLFENKRFFDLRGGVATSSQTAKFFDTLTADTCSKRPQFGLFDAESLIEPVEMDFFDDGTPYKAVFVPLNVTGQGDRVFCQIFDRDPAENATFQYLVETLDQGVWEYNLEDERFTASKSWYELRGLPHDRYIDMAKNDWLHAIHPEDRENLKSTLRRQKKGELQSMVVQYRHLHKKGHWVWILCRASVVKSDNAGHPIRIVGTDTDITEAMEHREEIDQLVNKLKLAVEASGMGIFEFDAETQKVHWDDRMLEIYGVTDGQNLRDHHLWETYLHPEDYKKTVARADDCIREQRDLDLEYRIVRPDTTIRHIRSLARTLPTSNGASRTIGVNIDVTEDVERRQELEVARLKLEHDSLHDQLTGLGNRRALDQATKALFNRLDRHAHYAVLHIDLDHFKAVNDTLGHSAGDFVLSKVGGILTGLVGERGKAFRVGGDEFVVLFEDVQDAGDLNDLCQALIDEIGEPMHFEGQPCSVGASIGYATGRGAPDRQSEIFVEADTALYAAKRDGRFCYRAYTEEIGSAFQLVSNTRQDLINAMNAEEIVCVLQPQYDADTLEILGAEALVRWDCPKRGLLAPAQFLQNATDVGMLGMIDRYVFERVAKLQTEWHGAGIDFPRISVNISRGRLEDNDLEVQTRAVLAEYHRIGFELLETTFMDAPSTAFKFKLDGLREMGIRIEIDDFGTGHASVKALQAIQPDAVKIDRSLVAPVAMKSKQLEILQNLTRIARLEDAEIVVEGLETGAHLAAIRKLDCDVLQGYVLQRPMSELEFVALLCKGNGEAKSGAG